MPEIISVWFSPVYHTRELCRVLGASLRDNLGDFHLREHDVTDFGAPENELQFAGEDIAILAAPVYAGRIPAQFAKKISAMQGNGASAIALVSYGNRAYDDALAELVNLAETSGFKPIAACACIARHTIAKECAQGRPDAKDLGEIRDFGRKIAEFLKRNEAGRELAVPGKVPDQPGPRFSLPQTVDENCVQCGICQAKCPAHAISFENSGVVDLEKCFCCMRCVALCPENARIPNPAFMEAIAKKLAPYRDTPKANEFFGLDFPIQARQ